MLYPPVNGALPRMSWCLNTVVIIVRATILVVPHSGPPVRREGHASRLDIRAGLQPNIVLLRARLSATLPAYRPFRLPARQPHVPVQRTRVSGEAFNFGCRVIR